MIVERKLVSGRSSYHVVTSCGGKKVWQRAESKSHARELEAEMLLKSKRNQLATTRDITFADLVERYFSDGVPNLRTQTIRAYRSKTTNHLLPYFSALKVRKGCTSQRIMAWMAWSRNQGTSPATIKGAFTALSAVLSYAVAIGLIYENPCSRVKAPRVEHNGVQVSLSPEDVQKVVSNTPKNERCLVEFLFLTGVRPSEAIEIRWRDISFSNQTIVISRTAAGSRTNGVKNHKPRVVPLSQVLITSLHTQRRTHYNGEDSLVFPASRGGRKNLSRFTEQIFRPALVRSGLSSEVPEGSRSLYLTRKTFISIMLNTGAVPLPTLAEWTGHSIEVLSRHYSKSRSEDGIRAMAALDSALSGVAKQVESAHG